MSDRGTVLLRIVATVLSAQTTDVNVNKATPKLFAQFPDASALAFVNALNKLEYRRQYRQQRQQAEVGP